MESLQEEEDGGRGILRIWREICLEMGKGRRLRFQIGFPFIFEIMLEIGLDDSSRGRGPTRRLRRDEFWIHLSCQRFVSLSFFLLYEKC